MKKYLSKGILILILYLISNVVFAEETVNFAIGEWAPYTSERDKNGKFAELIVKEAFEAEGINVIYKYYPWKRSYGYARDGTVDGTFPWNKTPDRLKEFNINNEPICVDNGVYFHLKSLKFDWKTMEDLKKYKLGTILGFKQEKIYEKAGLKFISAYSEEKNFKLMLLGKVEVFETSQYVGYYTLNTMFNKKDAELFTHHPKVVEKNEYYILFTKNERGKELAQKFDKGLKKLKETGRYKEIEKQFF